MFESILIRKNIAEDGNVDAGLLAEALLYYQNVHLILEYGTLISLLKSIGHENLIYLIENKFVKASYYRESLGTYTNSDRGVTIHDFIGYQLAGHKNLPKFKKHDVIYYAFEQALGNDKSVRRSASKFISKVPFMRLAKGFGHPSGIPGLAREDLDDVEYIESAVAAALREMVPTYKLPTSWHFKAIRIDNGFVVDTNLDFEAINGIYHTTIPPSHSTITPAYLLTQILDARADISLSSKYLSELVTTPTSSRIMQVRFSSLLQKRFNNASEIELFQEIHLNDARAIRSAINSGQRSFGEFIEVFEKSQKFKNWLRGVHPDMGLFKEYQKEVAKDTWVDKLPAKSVRFVICAGAGMLTDAMLPTGLGTAAGLSLGAADTFVLDRFLKGWTPDQFINGPVKDFTDRN